MDTTEKINHAVEIKRRTEKVFVFLAGINWDFLKQGQQYLAESLVRAGFSVIYVEPILHRPLGFHDFSMVLKRIKSYKKNVDQQEGNVSPSPQLLQLLSPICLPDTNSIFRWLNKKFFLPRIARQIKSIAGTKMLIANIWWPINANWTLTTLIDPDVLVYSCVENHVAMPGCPKDLMTVEKHLVSQSDYVFVTSDYLFNKWQNLVPGTVHLRPRAVNIQLYQAGDSGPVKKINSMVFYGGISRRIDFNLINKIADSGVKITLVGDIRFSPPPRFVRNISIIATVPPNELPGIIFRHDAIFWPYCLNEYTKGIYPAKIFECLASGKPIFSTALPNLEIDSKKYGIFLSTSSQQMIQQIRQFDGEVEINKFYEARKKAAHEHTWEQLLDKELAVMSEHIYSKFVDDSQNCVSSSL